MNVKTLIGTIISFFLEPEPDPDPEFESEPEPDPESESESVLKTSHPTNEQSGVSDTDLSGNYSFGKIEFEKNHSVLITWIRVLHLLGMGFPYNCGKKTKFNLTKATGKLASLENEQQNYISSCTNMDDSSTSFFKDEIKKIKSYSSTKEEYDLYVSDICNYPYFFSGRGVYVQRLCEYGYTIAIMGCLLYIPIMVDFLDFVKDNTVPDAVEIFFDIIPFFQYIFGLMYYRSPQFRHFAYRKIAKGTYWSKESPTCIIYISIISGLIGGILYHVYCFGNNYRFHIKNIMSFMAGLYAIPILFNNVAVFYMVFSCHKEELDGITRCVKLGKGRLGANDSTDSTVSVNNTTIVGCCCRCCTKCCGVDNSVTTTSDKQWIDINNIIVEVNDFRYGLERSIDAFSWIFSSSAFFGFLGTALTINQQIKLFMTKNDPWGNIYDNLHVLLMIVIWILLFSAFSLMAGQVSNSKNKILKSIRTPFYTQLCIARRHKSGDLSDKLTEWHLLNRILNEEWQEFSIFGINIMANMRSFLFVCFTSGVAAFAEII